MVDKRAPSESENVSGVPGKPLPNVVRGVLAGISSSGEPLVDFSTNSTGTAIVAASMTAVQQSDIGREAILLFEDGEPSRPILVGLLQPPASGPGSAAGPVEISVDGKRMTISAEDEIVLRCGRASITLTRAGDIVIRGTHLVSRSSGPNRIKGASVHLN